MAISHGNVMQILIQEFVLAKPKRLDLEATCEDFSNVIGTSPIGTLYKGTLSSGIEIVVASDLVTSKNWSKIVKSQFRRRNHETRYNNVVSPNPYKPYNNITLHIGIVWEISNPTATRNC
ncbi:Inactive receptor-like serine/threonine-protein kinase, partial [Mucuna pruriens]